MIKISKRQQINSHDWDELVVETYGKPYIFQQQEGCQERGTFILSVPDEEYDYDSDMHDDIPLEINGYEMGVKFQKWLKRTQKNMKRKWVGMTGN